ncbi:hypothetical protein JCM1840_005954 [Sporobolomyces johnsonii]
MTTFPPLELVSPPSPVSLSSLPPELLLEVLAVACTSSLFTPPLILHGQFTAVPLQCRTCTYRSLAGVCRTWRIMIREEIMGREVMLGVLGGEKDEQVLECVKGDVARAGMVRKVDASLRGWRGWTGTGWESAAAAGEAGSAEEGQSGYVGSREVELERQRQQMLCRERQRLVRLLQACRQIDTLDVDYGFYHDLRTQPTLLSPTIRTLTLRNIDFDDTFDVIERLPLLEDLTLRLALDWKRSPSSAARSSSSRLRRFELSITAFASTTLPDVLALLAGSRETLVSLTLRNKGATSASAKAFLPVSQGLISALARTLESLSVKDIPRHGIRLPSSPPTWSWFPSCPTSFPRLRHLHLTGLPSLSPSFFKSIVHLPSPSQLHRLTLEDFDSLSPRPLLEALYEVPALQRLRLLEVALRREVDAREEDREGWEEGTGAVERWCEGEGRHRGAKTRLRASWRMVKIHGCGCW